MIEKLSLFMLFTCWPLHTTNNDNDLLMFDGNNVELRVHKIIGEFY